MQIVVLDTPLVTCSRGVAAWANMSFIVMIGWVLQNQVICLLIVNTRTKLFLYPSLMVSHHHTSTNVVKRTYLTVICDLRPLR